MPDTNNVPTYRELLLETIHASVHTTRPDNVLVFNAGKFMRSWFTYGGGSYYFLFRNSLDTTDIQFSELISLIRRHSYRKKDNTQFLPFQFNSSKEFKQRIEILWESLGTPRPEEWSLIEKFYSDYYYELFGSTILVDCFYGSAVVHIPKNLYIKQECICAESGYIYSCGKAIYVRKTSKPNLLKDLEKKLEEHLDSHSMADTEKILFTTFSHEQFFEAPQRYRPERRQLGLIPGLTKEREDIKVYLSKYYFGDLHITDVLGRLNQRFSGKLYVSEQRPFEKDRDVFKNDPNRHTGRSIWLVVDSSITERNYSGDERYYIVFEQEYKNENIFILFDELKPGWIAPTTLPHSLATAMFNITRPYWPDIDKITIVDPFGGSGTTYLESIKYGDNIDFYSSDMDYIYEIVVKDNLRFFSLNKNGLKKFREFAKNFISSDKYINNIYKEQESGQPSFRKKPKVYPTKEEAQRDPSALYAWATVLFEKETEGYRERYRESENYQTLREIYSHKFSPGFKKHFHTEAPFFHGRILFYLMWRATLRNLYNLSKQEDMGIKDAIETEIKIFINAIETEFFPRREKPEEQQKHGRFAFQKELLATECIIDQNFIRREVVKVCDKDKNQKSVEHIATKDAIKALNEKSNVNVIITDPPYGFNTNVQSAKDFAALYKNVVPAMINSLSNEGQIVCCLPSISRNGQNIAAFTTKQFVINSIFTAIRDSKIEIVQPAFVRPNPSSLFEPPYYWESAKSLRRTICHFTERCIIYLTF